MRLNKKLFCFLFVMFITLICCCAVSAADDSDMETTATATATTSNDVVKDVESTSNVHSDEVTGSTDDTLESDNNNEEAVNQNGVLDENNNLNKVEKTKVSNRAVKTATPISGSDFLALAQDGVINLTEDVTISSMVSMSDDLRVNGNGYTINCTSGHHLFDSTRNDYKLTLYDVTVTGVSDGYYVIFEGFEHTFIACDFINNSGIYNEPAKDHEMLAVTMINCRFTGCKADAFNSPSPGTQSRHFDVLNCVFEGNENPIFYMFQHSIFTGYNFIIDGGLLTDDTKDDYVGDKGTDKPIERQQQVTIDINAVHLIPKITIDCLDQVYVDEMNDIKVNLTVDFEFKGNILTLGAQRENLTLEFKYEDGTTEYLYGTIDSEGKVKNLTDHAGRTFNQVAGAKPGTVNVTAYFYGSSYVDNDGNPLYNATNASRTYQIIQIPTTTVTTDVTGKVGVATTLTATVKNDSVTGNTENVPQGTVTFKIDEDIVGTAPVIGGVATLEDAIFGHAVSSGTITAEFHDENDKYADSSYTASIKIQPGEAVMEATPNPNSGVPGVNSTVTISVTDKNTNTLLPNGTVNVADSQTGEIIISDVEIINGEGSFLYNITKDTLLAGTTLNLTFSSTDYEDAKTQVTITRELIPTTTVVNPVNDTVYSPVTITANVTNNSGNLPVNQGEVTFTYNGNVIGTNQVSNGQASISYVFEEIVEDGVIYAQYVDNNDGEAKIFGDSEGSNENTGKTNIGKREAKITATPEPASGIPGVTSTVTITVTDVKDSNIKINGTVTIDDLNDTSKTFDPIEITEGEGTFDYSIIDTTLLTGNTLNFTFTEEKGNYENVDTTATIARLLIPTATVVDSVTGKVGVSTPVTATVTSSNGRVVDAGEVTFTYNGTVIGTAVVSDGSASIDVVFNHTIENGIITATYVDVREGEDKIFEESEGSNENTGKTNIDKGVANITAVAVPDSGIPGVDSLVNITVWDNNTGLPINGTVTINGYSVEIKEGKGNYTYPITVDTSRDGSVLTAVFSSPDYESVSDDVTITRELIPTTTVVDPVTGKVGVPTTVTAVVTSSNDMIVSQGNITFTFDGKVIGTATIEDGVATITVVFNNSVTDGLTTADYVDGNTGDAKIFDDSSSSTDIKVSGRTNIDKGEAEITAVAVPDSGIPGVISVVGITVTDKNTGLPISGTVTIDGSSVTIGKDGKGSYNYPIVDSTLLSGSVLTAVFSSPDYESVSDDVTITRELIPTVTVVSPVNGKVGVSTPVTATVTSSNGRVVDAGEVTFTYNGTVIGTAVVSDGSASIDVIFNHSVVDDIVTATYVDVREGEYKIFNTSSSSTDIEKSGKTNIERGVAVIEAVAVPDSGIPGVISVVGITVTDKNTGLPISGTVTIDGSSVTIGKDGKGSYNYPIVDSTLLSGSVLTAVFSSPDYESVSDDVTITRELIPTTTVVNSVRGTVGTGTVVSANVTSVGADGRIVDDGAVTFIFDGKVIGSASVVDGNASITVVFNHTIENGIITATYVDVREGEDKIFNDSEGSNENTGKTNIVKGVANITAEPDSRGIPGVNVTVTINVKDNNTGLPITGSVSIDGTTVIIGADGKGTYNYTITDDTSRDGSVLTAVFSSPDYESVSDTVTIGRDLIPTTTVVSPVNGMVGVLTPVTATVTSSNGRVVDAGEVTFTYDGLVIGIATISNGEATIDVVFNHTIENGIITATYVDVREGEDKIFNDSEGSNENTGKTNIDNGEAVIVAVANPAKDIPGVISVVDIEVVDANTGLPINGTVTIDGSTVDIIDGKGSYNYPITVDTSRDGSVLTAVFSSPDYNEVNDTVTVSRELIPTSIVVDPVTGTVGVPATVTAVVTSSNGRTVDQGKVTFTFDGKVIGTAIVKDGVATISVVFNNSVTDGLTTADYVDDNVGDAKIFDDSSSSTDIDESGRTNIVPGQAVISVVAIPDNGIPGVTSVVTITVTDKNTGLPIDGDVSIDGTTVPVAGGTAMYDYGIVDSTLRAGTVLTAEFSSPDYESVSADVTVYRLLIPTSIVVEPVNGVVGIPTTITAVVTSSNGRPVTQGIVTFTYNGQVIGVADVTIAGDESVSDVKMASPGDATASISVVFNNSIKDGLITADYVDDNVGEAKIFDDSSSSTDIDESGRTNIVPGEAVIVAVADPARDIPGVISVVDITVTDKNTGLPIDGTVTIDGSTVDIIDGEGSYDYLITDDTSRDGSVLTAVFSSPDYESLSDDVTISRELIPTTTVVSPVTGSVGSPVTVTAVVTSSNGRTVTQGKVSFTFDGKVIGTATISNGIASISVVFNNSITDGLTTADYVDDNVGEAKIFDISSSSTDIDESGRTNIVPGQASIDATPIPASGIPGVISVVDITVTDANTGLPINGIVSIDGTNVTIVDGKGSYNYPITVDTSRDGTVLTAVFSSPDYESVSDDVTITREIIPTNTNASVINNTAGNVIIKVNVTDIINDEPVPNGTVEVYVNDTLVGKGEIVDGVVDIVTGITEVGTYDITVKYTGNDVYTDSEDVLEDVEVVSLEPRIIKIGFWKLVCFNVTPEKNTTNYTKPSKVIKPAIRYKAHRTTKFTGSSKYYRAVNNYRHYKPSWKKSSSRPIIIPPMSKLQYRLFIVLYADVMEGDMSFADFVAILKLNGIEIATLNSWNENGEIIIDYDNLEEVPDSIEIVDNGGHLEDYSQSINKNNAPDNEGVIDSGDVEVKSKASNTESSNAPSTSGSHASSSNAGSSGDSGVAAADGE